MKIYAATPLQNCIVQADILEIRPQGLKTFSCSTQLSMKFFLLINVKMPTIVGLLTFMSMKNSILGLSDPQNAEFFYIFILLSI